MDRTIHKLLLVMLITIATTLLSGCPIQTKRVLVIGDSISYGSAGEISRVGNMVGDADPVNRMTFAIIAYPGVGARQTFGTPSDPDEYWFGLIANSIHPGDFDAVVVQLGTNDCALLSAAGDYQPDIARIASAISDADPNVPVFWLTLQQHPRLPDCASIIDGDLRQVVESGSYPKLTTFAYGTWAEAHSDCFPDRVHPREPWNSNPDSGGSASPAPTGYCDGQFQYATWLKAQLDSYFGPPTSQ